MPTIESTDGKGNANKPATATIAMSSENLSSNNNNAAGAAASVVDPSTIKLNIFLGKVVYFLTFAAFSCALPFYSLFLHSRGFTPTVIGLIVAVAPLANLFVAPPLTYIADKKHLNTPIIVLSVTVGGVVLLLGAMGSTDVTKMIASVSSGGGNATDADKGIINGGDSFAAGAPTTTNANSFMALLFAAVGVGLQSVVSAPSQPLIDHHTMALIPKMKKEGEREAVWGQMRQYGAYGWGIFAPIAALIVEYYGFSWCFVVYLVLMVLMLLCLLKSHVVRAYPTEMNMMGVMKFLIKKEQRRVFALLIACAIMGVGMAVVGTYLFIFLDSQLSAPKVLLGISVTVTVVTEIPLFKYSKHVNAWMTPQQMLIASMVGWSMRVLCYSFLTNPWLVLLIEPFHGVTFGLTWLGGVRVVTTSYPPDLAASAFGSLFAFVFGIGGLVGMVCGGYFYDAFGPYGFFRACSFIMATVAVVYYFVDKQIGDGPASGGGGEEKSGENSKTVDAFTSIDDGNGDTSQQEGQGQGQQPPFFASLSMMDVEDTLRSSSMMDEHVLPIPITF